MKKQSKKKTKNAIKKGSGILLTSDERKYATQLNKNATFAATKMRRANEYSITKAKGK